MFRVGHVVSAPIPATGAGFAVRNHFLVVVKVQEDGGVFAVYTTSVKEGRVGGEYAFSQEEMKACRFGKACRFDPSYVVFYPKEELGEVHLTGGYLSEVRVHRVLEAITRVRPRPIVFRSRLMQPFYNQALAS